MVGDSQPGSASPNSGLLPDGVRQDVVASAVPNFLVCIAPLPFSAQPPQRSEIWLSRIGYHSDAGNERAHE